MSFNLTTVAGPATGQRIPVHSCQKVRGGRYNPCEHIIEADDYLSGIHFAVSDLGGRYMIEDLKSRNGLFVNGERVQKIELHRFDIIRAGSSEFVVNFSEEGPTNAGPVHPPALNSLEQINSLVAMSELSVPGTVAEVLRQSPGNLFCVVDPARDDAILELLQKNGAQRQILYDGKSAEDLSNYGPYLVELPGSSGFLLTLLEKGWGNSWCVFIKTKEHFQEVRKHLRRFLVVDMADGKKALFRFYDPRVMRLVIPGFAFAEAAHFFGPIDFYCCEAAKPSNMVILQLGAVGVEMNVISVGGKDR